MAISEGKGSDLSLTEAMKTKYRLEKKKRGYTISSIKDNAVRMATQLLAGKVMCKCSIDKVPMTVVALAEQCAEGVQFDWVNYLCREFIENFHEA